MVAASHLPDNFVPLIDDLDLAVRPFLKTFRLDQLRVLGVVFEVEDFYRIIGRHGKWRLTIEVSADGCLHSVNIVTFDRLCT